MVYRIEEHSKSDNPENDDECEKITSLQVLYITFFGDEIQLTCREKKKTWRDTLLSPRIQYWEKSILYQRRSRSRIERIREG